MCYWHYVVLVSNRNALKKDYWFLKILLIIFIVFKYRVQGSNVECGPCGILKKKICKSNIEDRGTMIWSYLLMKLYLNRKTYIIMRLRMFTRSSSSTRSTKKVVIPHHDCSYKNQRCVVFNISIVRSCTSSTPLWLSSKQEYMIDSVWLPLRWGEY